MQRNKTNNITVRINGLSINFDIPLSINGGVLGVAEPQMTLIGFSPEGWGKIPKYQNRRISNLLVMRYNTSPPPIDT